VPSNGQGRRVFDKPANLSVWFLRLVTCVMIVTVLCVWSMATQRFNKMACHIARSLERVGEWRSILIIRDALNGFTRFDQFQRV
jgi:hypothetical protein